MDAPAPEFAASARESIAVKRRKRLKQPDALRLNLCCAASLARS